MGIIVIVDDEPMVTVSLKAMLNLETTHQVHCFNHPEEALAQVETIRPDVVISDFSMPGMNGIVFLRQVKSLLPDSALILLTGYADKENAIEAINTVGIYRYIEKPWNNEDLKFSIQTAIERRRLINDLSAQKALERMREDFVSTLTHDLRTPLLAAIQTLKFFLDGTLLEGNLSQGKLLESNLSEKNVGVLSSRQQELIHMLIENNQELLGLVNTLLDVYRYEAGHRKLIWDQIPVVTLIQEVVQCLEPLAQSRQQTLEMCIESNASALKNTGIDTKEETQWTVQGDKQELRRVLMNLIGNAIHFTPLLGNIWVKIKWIQNEPQNESPRIQICIEDNGRGIPAQDISMLFQRFSQGTCKQRSSGSGLGLYLSRQIIEAHDGRIWVESQEGIGSRFFIALAAKVTART